MEKIVLYVPEERVNLMAKIELLRKNNINVGELIFDTIENYKTELELTS